MAVARKPVPRTTVRKAKPEPQWVAIYDAHGQLIGVCDPAKIIPVTDGDPVTKGHAKHPFAEAGADTAAQVQELKKGLNAPRLAAENDRHAAEMGAAALRAIAALHSPRPAA